MNFVDFKFGGGVSCVCKYRDGKALQEKQAKKAAGEAAGGSKDAGGKGTKK